MDMRCKICKSLLVRRASNKLQIVHTMSRITLNSKPFLDRHEAQYNLAPIPAAIAIAIACRSPILALLPGLPASAPR